MNKFILFIIVLLLLSGGYYFYAQNNRQAVAPTVESGSMSETTGAVADNQTQEVPDASTTSAGPSPSPLSGEGIKAEGNFSTGEEGMAPDILVVQIDYDGSKYSPQVVNIAVGDIVIFKNNSTGQMWPASAPHPTHINYSEFDARQAIAAGGKWQFKFEKVGEWKFHDHLNPLANGVINVLSK